MRLKLVLAALLVGMLVMGALAAYVALSVQSELGAARRALTGDLARLRPSEIQRVVAHLRTAEETLASAPALPLYFVPLLRQNLGALDAAVHGARAAAEEAVELRRVLDRIDRSGVVGNGRIRVGLLETLGARLDVQARALTQLEDVVERNTTGWLLPPVWEALEELRRRAGELAGTARRGRDAVAVARSMLAGGERRDYLVLLMNNAELRGAGGILSGIGILSADQGKLELGPFAHYFSVDEPPYETVPAPRDFKRRYSLYGADTTRFVNATFSPDVPDVAVVAARAFRVATGIQTDGAILIDPHAIAAFLPPDASLQLPGGRSLAGDDLPRYVYSDAYTDFTGRRERRREALIDVGRAAFEVVLQRGLDGTEDLAKIADAISGGHLSIVSFEDDEQALLEDLGTTGDLTPPGNDGMLVTMQNFGENKLDFWTEREVAHRCIIREDDARCSTQATFANEAPRGLPLYVSGRPAGLLKNLAEVYVPRAAELVGVESSDDEAGFRRSEQDGYQVVASLLEIPRGESTSVTVTYRLPLGPDGYSLVALPQPLARDARIDVALALPRGWQVEATRGEVDRATSVFRYRGRFDRTITVEAGPRRARRAGLPALWERLGRFWREPVSLN